MIKNVFGQPIKYKFTKLKEDDGLYHTLTKTIEISDKLKGREETLTILHEELHAIFDVLGFSSVVKDDVEELLVDNISRWICENYHLKPKTKPSR